MFVCMYGTYTNSHFWTDLNQTLHTSPPWSRGGRRVCMDQKFSTSSNFWALFLWGPLQNHGHKMAAGATVFRDTLIPWFQLVLAWRHRHDVVADGGVVRGSLISVILAGVPLTSRKWRCSRRQSHPPQRRIPYSGWCSRHVTSWILRPTGRRGHPPQPYIPHSRSCFCELQEITSLQTTVARSYSKCVALSVIAYDTLGRERDPCVYNSEPHETGRKWLKNCKCTNNV